MRRPNSIGVTGLTFMLLSACGGMRDRGASTYIVRPQDTLYSIAWRHDLDYRDLATWNNVGPDYRITIGQELSLVPRPRAARSAAQPAPSAAPAPAGGSRPLPGVTPPLGWVWPTDRTGAPRATPSGGLLFVGHPGQLVRAAAPGRVVYTGAGLRGYGQLVIIKHDAVLLSAYAYNRELLVREGDAVGAGQPIAAMGQGAQQSAALYFEIRLNGKATNPLPYLLGEK